MAIPEVTIRVKSVRTGSPLEVGSLLTVEKSPAVIGRATDCDIQLLDPTVSRLHVRIDLERDRIALTSLSRRSITVVDGRRLEAGQRFESRYRPISLIFGTVECELEVSFETEEPAWKSIAAELTADGAIINDRTLDIPGLNAPANDAFDGRVVNEETNRPRNTEPSPPAQPFMHVIDGRAAAAVSVRGKWLELPRMTALALSALCKQPGLPVAEEIIERASGSESMVTKHVSMIRSAIRELIESGDLEVDEIYRQLDGFPGFSREELEALSLEELMRKFILSRRGFGYILHVRAEEVLIEESR